MRLEWNGRRFYRLKNLVIDHRPLFEIENCQWIYLGNKKFVLEFWSWNILKQHGLSANLMFHISWYFKKLHTHIMRVNYIYIYIYIMYVLYGIFGFLFIMALNRKYWCKTNIWQHGKLIRSIVLFIAENPKNAKKW